MADIPVKILCTPFWVKPLLVGCSGAWGTREIERSCAIIIAEGFRETDRLLSRVGTMRQDTLLKVFPHVQYQSLMIPPFYIMSFCFFKILFPHMYFGG